MKEELEEYLDHKSDEYNGKTLLPRSFFRDNFRDNHTEVLDKGTSHALQINDLSKLISENTITKTGKFLVDYSIRNPLISVDNIKAKHEALDEIKSNDKIRRSVENILSKVKQYEGGTDNVVDVFNDNGGAAEFLNNSKSDYKTQSDIRAILGSLPRWAKNIPEPESEYLRKLTQDIGKNLRNSSSHKLGKGPIFRHLLKGKIYGLEEIAKEHPIVSPLPFNPLPFQAIPILMGFAGPMTPLFYILPSEGVSPDAKVGMVFAALVASGLGTLIGHGIGVLRDKYNFFRPMRKVFRDEPEAVNVYKAIGCLDELLAYDRFKKQLPNASLPEVLDSERHEFFAEGLVNPLQSQKIDDYIPNDVALNNGQRLTFLTGPNSGGKTSLGKSIAQAQVLAQIGCYVPATKAKISIADKIFYQVGNNDTLDDDEGGLGTQFRETKRALFSGTPKSLVIVDDLIEGTTFDEKTRHTKDQLYGFLHKGTNTVYISHHFELAKHFRDKGLGNFWQVDFDGEKPTHKIVPGISTNSHSDVVAKRVGFDGEAITEHLIKEGYLIPGQNLDDFKYN